MCDDACIGACELLVFIIRFMLVSYFAFSMIFHALATGHDTAPTDIILTLC